MGLLDWKNNNVGLGNELLENVLYYKLDYFLFSKCCFY